MKIATRALLSATPIAPSILTRLRRVCLAAWSVLAFHCALPQTQAIPPTEEWVRTYNGAAGDSDRVVDAAIDANGNFYVCGNANEATLATPDLAFVVVKYNAAGDQVWVARYSADGNQTSSTTSAQAMSVDESGNVFVTGKMNSKSMTVKFDATGALQWATATAANGWSFAIGLDAAGNCFVCGRGSTANSFQTIKYNSAGVQQWLRTRTGDTGRTIAVDAAGNSHIAGWIDVGSGFNSHRDFLTVKYDTAGVEQWARTYGFSAGSYEMPEAIILDAAGNSYVGGSVGNGMFGLVKYDASGTEVWARTKEVTNNDSNTDGIADLAIDSAGNVIGAGKLGNDLAAIKYKSDGTEVWTRRYQPTGNGFEGASGVDIDGSDNIYVTGDLDVGSFNGAISTVKYSPAGDLAWAKTYRPANSGDFYAYGKDVGIDAAGNVFVGGERYAGADVDLVAIRYTPAPPPTVTTTAATPISSTTATLNGTINPNGNAATAYFEYGTTPDYGSQTPVQNIANGTTAVAISANLMGLLPETTYYFRAVGVVDNTASGAGFDFTTPEAPPVTTEAATNLSGTGARLNGSVAPTGGSVTVRFEYGTTTNYGSQTSEQILSGPVGIPIPVSAQVTGLTRSTEYHFRLTVVDGLAGDDAEFTTASNTAPLAVDDTLGIRTKAKSIIPVLANDSDPEADSLNITAVTQGAAGKVELSKGAVTYTPGKNFIGTDTFTYTVSDGLGASSQATVTINNPFLLLGGAYQSVLTDDNGLPQGIVKVKVSTTGVVSGSVIFDGKNHALKGSVGFDGHFTQTIARKGLGDLTVTLVVSDSGLDAGMFDFRITDGTITHYAGGHEFVTALPAGILPGKYTLVIPPAATVATEPFGNSYATGTLSAKGALRLTGKLADGTAFSVGAQLQADGSVRFLLPLYSKPKGYLDGYLAFAATDETDFEGTFLLVKPTPAAPGKQLFPDGFALSLTVYGSSYLPPAKGFSAVHGQDFGLDYQFIGILDAVDSLLVKQLTIEGTDVVTVDDPDSDKLTLKIARATGLVSGSFVDFATGKKRTLGGAVFQKDATIAGTFTDAVGAWPFFIEQPSEDE